MRDRLRCRAFAAADNSMNTMFKEQLETYIQLTKHINELGKQHRNRE